jgi:outer membrane biosynthesis protein TonB
MLKENCLFNTNIAVSEEEDQMKEMEETLDDNSIDEGLEQDMDINDNKLENSRMERDADPEKKRNLGKKAKKNKRKNKPAGRRNKNGKKHRKGAKKQRKSESKQRKSAKKQTNGAKKQRKGGKKQGKKQRKGVKQPKAGKRNKKGKKSAKTQESNSGRSPCSRAVNSTCLDTAVKMLNLVNTKISNFLVQQKRISKYNSTGGKKSNKKGLFGPIASKVIDVGGGNASDLSCSGNKTNVGATKLKSIIASLQKCEADIKAACDPTAYPLPNTTEANACKTNAESMKASVKACTAKTGDEACTCWLDSDLKTVAGKVKKCDISSANKLVTAQHKYCTGNFSACKKIEDTAVTYIYACSQSAATLKVKAAQTKANVDALGAAKNKTSTLAGSTTGRNTVIRKRATSVSTCTDFVTLSASLLTIASDSPTSSTVATMAKILSAVSDSLTCSTTEKASLTTQVTTYTQTISKVSATYSGLKSSVEGKLYEEIKSSYNPSDLV